MLVMARHLPLSVDVAVEYQNITKTKSPFWWEPNITKLIAESKNDHRARVRLVELVYRPAFRRLDKWFAAAGLKRLNVEADDVFDELWLKDLNTAIDRVVFRNREHFLRLVLKRGRQSARRAARRIRKERVCSLVQSEPDSRESRDVSEIVESAELFSKALNAMHHLKSPRYEIVNLHFIEGLTIRQIADEIKLPRSTVHRQLEIALKELRHAVSK